MDKKSANKIVRDTLEAPFKKEAFVYFIKNFINFKKNIHNSQSKKKRHNK